MSVLQPDIQIFTMVLGYQKRCWWQLSSILEQVSWEGRPVPKIQYVASVYKGDPWWEWNERLLKVFRDAHGLDLVLDVYEKDNPRVGERGHIRTRNLQNATATWVQWADADQIYPREFFSKQHYKLSQHAGDHRVMALGRRSMAFESGYRIVESESYDAPIRDAYQKAATRYPTWLAAGGRASGAGFHQVIDLKAVKEFATAQNWPALTYVPETYSRDHNIATNQQVPHLTRSDKAARTRLGGVVPLSDPADVILTGQLHLNHGRRQDVDWDPKRQH